MTESRRVAALAGLCAAVTALLYLPVLTFPFLHWDDGVNFLPGPGRLGLSWIFEGTMGNWMPLTKLLVLGERAAWGADPLGYHAIGVLIHAANAALVYLLSRALLRPKGREAPRGIEFAAVLTSLFWALHPLRVECAAWASDQNYLLAGFLMLSSTLAYLRGVRKGDGESGAFERRAALALGAAAMTAKVFALLLPAVFLVIDVRLRGRARWKEKWPWLLPAAAVFGLTVAAQLHSGGAVAWGEFGLRPRLTQALYGLSFYPLKTLWPFGLSPLYERSPLLEPAPFLFGAAASLAGLVSVWSLRRRFPGLAQGALAYVLLVLPSVGLFKTGRMTVADRYAYLSGIPLALLAGAAVARFASKRGTVPAGLALIAAAAALTTYQLPVWSSDVELWTRAAVVSPLSYFARLKLAQADASAGRTAAAAADYTAAERLHTEVFSRAAEIYAARGDGAAAAAARSRAREGLGAFAAEPSRMVK